MFTKKEESSPQTPPVDLDNDLLILDDGLEASNYHGDYPYDSLPEDTLLPNDKLYDKDGRFNHDLADELDYADHYSISTSRRYRD
jgi:hypothetical protein